MALGYANSPKMVRELARARLLTVDGYGHTALLDPSACANRFAAAYLLRGSLPPKGTVCRQNARPFT